MLKRSCFLELHSETLNSNIFLRHGVYSKFSRSFLIHLIHEEEIPTPKEIRRHLDNCIHAEENMLATIFTNLNWTLSALQKSHITALSGIIYNSSNVSTRSIASRSLFSQKTKKTLPKCVYSKKYRYSDSCSTYTTAVSRGQLGKDQYIIH